MVLFISVTYLEPEQALIAQTVAFCFAILAMFLPLFGKFYDAIILQISRICRGELSMRAACFALVALLLTIPTMISTFCGCSEANIGGEDDTVAGVLDEANATAETAFDDAVEAPPLNRNLSSMGDSVQDLFAGAADMASDVVSDLFWMKNPMPAHHQAAVKIQAIRRGQLAKRLSRSSQHHAEKPPTPPPQASKASSPEETRPFSRQFSWLEKQMQDAEPSLLTVSEVRLGRPSQRAASFSHSGSTARPLLGEPGPLARARSARDGLHDRLGIVYTRFADESSSDRLLEARARAAGARSERVIHARARASRRVRALNTLPEGMPPDVSDSEHPDLNPDLPANFAGFKV